MQHLRKLFVYFVVTATSLFLNFSHVSASVSEPLLEPISVQFAPQQWQFEIEYGALRPGNSQLAKHEQELGRALLPLLNSKNYAQAWQIINQASLDKPSFAILQIRGQLALQLKKQEEAAKSLNQALKLNPHVLAVHRTLAAINLQKNNLDGAMRHIQAAIKLGDNDPSMHAQLAYIHMQNNAPYAAIAGYQNALFLDPNNLNFQQGLSWALAEGRHYKAAAALLIQLINNSPDNHELWLQLAQNHLLQGDTNQALANIEMALRLTKKTPAAKQQWANKMLAAQLHLMHGSRQQSLLLMQEVINNTRLFDKQIIEALALLVKKGDQMSVIKNKSLSKFIESLDKQQSKLNIALQSQYLTLKAQLAKYQGRNQHARKLYAQAIELHSRNGHALLQLGALLSSEQLTEQASLYFSRAAALPDFQQRAWLAQAQLAIDKQHFGQALKLLKKALKKDPTRQDLRDNIKQLERLQQV